MEATKLGLKLEAKVRTNDEIRKLFLPGELGAILDWEVKNPDGKITSKGIKKSESFVRQFMDLLLVKFWNLSPASFLQIKDIAGNMRDVSNNSFVFAANGAVGDVNMGVIVGTGIGAEHVTDYVIGTIIPHDAGAHVLGTMQYGAVTYGAPASDPTTSQFTITRNFANATAGAITVQEIALYVKAIIPYTFEGVDSGLPGGVAAYFMTIRDLTGGIAVNAGQTLTVNYRPQVVV